MPESPSTSAAILAFAFCAGIAWGQAPQFPTIEQLRNVDARDSAVPGQTATQRSQERMLVQRRIAAAQSYLAAQRAGTPGLRLTPNRFGFPKLLSREGAALSGPSREAPETIARNFLRRSPALFSLAAREIDDLRLVVNDATPRATFLVLNQTLDGIDVFQAQIKFTLNAAGEIAQVASGEIAPGLALSTSPRLSAQEAVRAAYEAIEEQPPATLTPNGGNAFANPRGSRYNPITAELSIFPLNASMARLAYRVYLDFDAEHSYEILVDAQDGRLLYRCNLYVNDAQAQVWTQPPSATGARQWVNFPTASTASPGPWLAQDASASTGNNGDAFLDADGDSKPDATTSPDLSNGRAFSPTQVFNFPFGDGIMGLDPRNFQAAAVTNLFYWINAAHDYYYGLGFTEDAGNFQSDNYGRGGAGNDAVLAHAQYGGFTNNASFSFASDGAPPHIRMGIFTRGTSDKTDDLDSDYDGQVVFHEYAHGVSSRLVGGKTSTSCLGQVQSGAMGEGWSDYFGTSFFNTPVLGAYVSQNLTRGSRRYSYEGYPYTYEDLGNQGYEVHSDGEIWAATLWDLRKALGQTLADQLVVDGMKATPCNPSMTNARDAILSVDLASHAGAHRAAIWQVFAKHGLGYSAFGVDGKVGVTLDGFGDVIIQSGMRYDAAYDQPPDLQGSGNPAITSDPWTVTVAMGQAYLYTVRATNPNSGVLNYSVASGPPSMTIDPATGRISWVSTFTGGRVKIVVTDGMGGKVVHGYWLGVEPTHLLPGVPLAISGDPNGIGAADVTIPAGTQILRVTLQQSPATAMLSVNGPGLISITQSSTPVVSIVGPAAGRWSMMVGVSAPFSGVLLTASLVTPTPLAPNSSMTGLSAVASDQQFFRVTVPPGAPSLTVSTSGGTGNLSLYLRRGWPLPVVTPRYGFPYDFVSANSGNYQSITVPNPDPGDWYINVMAKTASSGFSLAVSTPVVSTNALTITTPRVLPAATAQQAYSQTLEAINGVPPYRWSFVQGYLPYNLTLSQSGVISGTPTGPSNTSQGVIPNYWFAVQVTDSAPTPATATVGFTLTLTGGMIAITNPFPTPGVLPSGFVGGAYSLMLAAAGGTPPYSWSASNLPPGLALSADGVLSGTPTAAGSFTPTISVRNSTGGSSYGQRLSMAIIAPTGPLSRIGVFPQIAAGGDWSSGLWLVNNSSQDLPVRLVFHGDDGAVGLKDANWIPQTVPLNITQMTTGVVTGLGPLSVGAHTVLDATVVDAVAPANQALVLTTNYSGIPVQGWVEALSTAPMDGYDIVVSGVLGQAVSPVQKTGTVLTFPFDNTSGRYLTAFGLTRLAGGSLPIVATAWDADWNVIVSDANITYKPYDAAGHTASLWPQFAHDAFLLPDALPATAGERGTVRITIPDGALIDAQIAAMGLLVDLTSSSVSSIPMSVE